MTDYQAVRWHALQPDQVRAMGMDRIRQLELLKLNHVFEAAEADALRAELGDDEKIQYDGYTELISKNTKAVAEYDVRIAATLKAIPAEGPEA